MFAIADEQFDRVREEREEYLKTVESKTASKEDFLEQEINFDTVKAYANWRFPKHPTKYVKDNDVDHIVRNTISRLDSQKYAKLADIERTMQMTDTIQDKMEKSFVGVPSAPIVVVRLAVVDKEFRKKWAFDKRSEKWFEELEPLVIKSND